MQSYTGLCIFVRNAGEIMHYPMCQFDVDVGHVIYIDDINFPINESFYAADSLENCPNYSNHPSFILYPKRYVFCEVELRAEENDPDGIVPGPHDGLYFSRCIYIKKIINYNDPMITKLNIYPKPEIIEPTLYSDEEKEEIDAMEEKIVTSEEGDTLVYHGAILHNLNGPAITMQNGTTRYFHYGNEVKIIWENGDVLITKNGILHNENGPAVISRKGKSYWINGELHRIDGPAMENNDGSYEWYYRGIWHNPNGPAVKTYDGKLYYYIHGDRLTDRLPE